MVIWYAVYQHSLEPVRDLLEQRFQGQVPPLRSAEESGQERDEGDADEGDTAAGHQLLHALGLRAGVIVAGLRSAPVGAKPTSTGRRAPFQQVDSTPDAKTGTERHDESLQYTNCAVEKCHR